jgi:8-oxo-dGTP pyrophosphatase MutT (NUDIX family)
MEKGETPEICAVREVEEETGVTNLKLKKKAGETYHTYNDFGKHNLKVTHWYYMTCSSKQTLVPQTEEDIAAIKWVNTKEIKEPLANTYPSIKDILSTFFDTP